MSGSNLAARRFRQGKTPYHAKKDPRYASAPAFTFGGRYSEELDVLASNTPFFCKTGTHRCPQGEVLLDHLRRRDDRSIDKLIIQRRHWKATPGPGAYRIPRTIGDIEFKWDLHLDEINIDRAPIWKFGTGNRSRTYHSIGSKPGDTWEHEGALQHPKPYNLTPGPGHYFQDSCCGISTFTDFRRPQNARGTEHLAREQDTQRKAYFYKAEVSKGTPTRQWLG